LFIPQIREEPGSGLFTGSAVLEGTPGCTPSPVSGWVGCEGEANLGHWTPRSRCARWLPQQRGWQPTAPLGFGGGCPGAGLGQHSSPALGQGVAAFGGLHEVMGGHLPIHQEGSGTALGGQNQLVLIKINGK